MKNNLTYSLVVISFVLGLGTGFAISPEYQNKMTDKKTVMVEIGKADKYTDQRYIDGMIGHHLNAIYMANQALTKSSRSEIKSLAQEIIKADEASIKELYEWKKTWYKNSRQVTNYTKINLGEYDEKFDLRFINALITHHDEAIVNATDIRTKSIRNEILNLADGVISGLTTSKTKLQEFRKTWYQI